MIVAFVTFTPTISRDEAIAKMDASTAVYRKVDGLIRKYYVDLKDGRFGGIYLWESRAKAEAFYDESWPARFDAYGAGVRPKLEYMDCAFVVDNKIGETISGVKATAMA